MKIKLVTNGVQRLLLHWVMDSALAHGHGLHVGVSEACDLQILLCLHNAGKCCHHTHWRPCLKQHNACKHTKLWVKSLVHVELKSQFLDLIWKRKQTQYAVLSEIFFSNTLRCCEFTILGSFFAMFLKAMMASAWTLMGRDSAAVPCMGRIFVIGLRLLGWPALPKTFRSRMMFWVSSFATASARSSWMGCWWK